MATFAQAFQVPPDTKGTLITPTRFVAMMCGSDMALIEPDGRTTLHYTDGTIERGQTEPGKAWPEYLDLVSAVQDQRPATEMAEAPAHAQG